MKLYDAVWAPSPRRVRIYLAEKGIEVERELIDLRKGEHFQPPYAKINPRMQVPALLLDDGTLIDDSLGVCRYFEALHPTPPLFGRDAREAGLVEAWIRRIESDYFAAVAYVFRNKSPAFADRAISGEWPPIAQIPALVERGQQMAAAFAPILDRHLAASEYMVGDAVSVADIMALTTMDFALAAKLPDPREHPSIARWHAAVSARPSATAG